MAPRTKNALFLGELTKFGIVPDYVSLHAVKSSIDDFSAPSIEVLGVLLETCGRYLLRTPATGDKMSVYLEQMQRKRNAQNLEPRLALVLENAYYQTCPPERVAKVVKERTPKQLFVHHVFYKHLDKDNMRDTAVVLRRLDWNDEYVWHELFKAFTKPWRLRHTQIAVVAELVRELFPSHGAFFVRVCDHVLESVKQSMDSPRFEENQARRAMLVYVGELINVRVFHLNVLVELLWSLCLYGHPPSGPNIDDDSKTDPPDDYMRLILVCVLLSASAPALGKKVVRRYIYDVLHALNALRLSKFQPMPLDVEAQLGETVRAIAGAGWMSKSWTDDPEIAREKLAVALSSRASTENTEAEEGDDDRDEADDEPDERDTELTEEIVELEPEPAPIPEPYDPEAELRELDSELAKLMSETSTVPSAGVMSGTFLRSQAAQHGAPRRQQDISDGGMTFSFLSKRGSKPQAQNIVLPQSSLIVHHTRKAQEEEEEERRQLKQYVLAYRDRAHDEDTL